MKFSTYVSVALTLATQTLAASYSQTSNVVGNGFYNFFSFEAIPDPTHGRV
jgi:hypothetical protein